MSRPPPVSPASPDRRAVWLAGAGIALGAALAYVNSFNVPFLFDDNLAIVRNPTIRDLWSADVLSAPLNATGATGRPLVNLSLAFNYALGGASVRGYHVFNLLLHVASALLLFGTVRRTLENFPCRSLLAGDPTASANPARAESPASRLLQKDAGWIALAIALLWAVHPLQTESVTCIIQRTELLGGFFLLLTLYCFIRHTGEETDRARPWAAGAIAACALGMAAKEFMAVAPLLLLLYDRAFAAGTFRAAWTQRRGVYLGLAASWLVFAGLLLQNPTRNHNVGFGLGVGAWDYLLTQCHAVVLYLRLAFWPHPLVLDYGAPLIHGLAAVWWQALLLVTLFATTVWSLWRNTAAGFLGAWFFVILAPSSSFIPLTTQTIAEHQMYLPLAAVITAVAAILWRKADARTARIGLALAAGGCAALTWSRNADYASRVSIWTDTVAQVPDNYRARYNLGNALAEAGRPADALPHYEAALRLRPDESSILYNYADALGRTGRGDEAITQFQAALQAGPDRLDVRVNLGAALARAGRIPEAIAQYQQAAAMDPAAADLRASLGSLLVANNQLEAGLAALEQAVKMKPDYLAARVQLADTLAGAGHVAEAIAQYEAALRLKPGSAALRQRLEAARELQPRR